MDSEVDKAGVEEPISGSLIKTSHVEAHAVPLVLEY